MKDYFDIAAYADECQAEDRGVREDIQNEIKRMLDLNKFPVVNARGLALIKAWVKQTTKHDAFGPAHDVGPRSLDAWCIEAEESALNGNLPLIEMQAISTRSGRTETLLLDLLHLDFVDQLERN